MGNSKIVISRPSEPDPKAPPRLAVLFGAALVIGVTLLGLGFVGDPPATGDLAEQAEETELGSVPSTAVTTLGSTTTSTAPPRFDTPLDVEVVTADTLGQRGFTFNEVPPPEGIQVITHLVESRHALFAFGRKEPGAPTTALLAGRWNGAWWDDPVEVVPEGESVVTVAGGDSGLLVVSVRGGPLGVFPGSSDPGSYLVRTSGDGRDWLEQSIGDIAGEGLYVQAAIVTGDGAWLIGLSASELDVALTFAFPAPYQELVADGRVFVAEAGQDEISLHEKAFGTPLATFDRSELGIGDQSQLRNPVMLWSPDLTRWEHVPAPPYGRWVVAAGSGSGDAPFVASPAGLWRNLGETEWEQSILFSSGAEPVAAAVIPDAMYTVAFAGTGPEIHRYGSDGQFVRYRFDIAGQDIVGPGPGAGSQTAVMFPTTPGLRLLDRVPRAIDIGNGNHLVANLDRGAFRVENAEGVEIASASMYSPDPALEFDPHNGLLRIIDRSGDVAGSVTLEQLEEMAAEQLRYEVAESGGVLYVYGDEWRFQSLADLAPDAHPTLASAVVGMDNSFAIASGPIYPWIATDAPSQIWIATPRP